ncbi:type II toxin-antitoxin system PemK/MazF family toxin [Nostoc sp. UHCC 0302]|uniref:type II toxin-antitoxin system PemK/MazF family toxin n=1 Tax=Nostoc sp. UHCC 0302 TaxID=3134896 RepID=UPI00311CA510
MTQPKQTLKRGDVVLVLFPNSNLTTAKTRPAVIVQADNLQTGLSQMIVAMITSQMFRAANPSRVTILNFRQINWYRFIKGDRNIQNG